MHTFLFTASGAICVQWRGIFVQEMGPGRQRQVAHQAFAPFVRKPGLRSPANMVPGGKSGRWTDVRFGKPDAAALIVQPSGVISRYSTFEHWISVVCIIQCNEWLDFDCGLSNQSEHCCWTNLRILAWVWPLPFLAASEFWTPVTSFNESLILRTKRDKCFKFKGCSPAALNAHCSIFVVSSSPWSWWWLPVQLHYCWLGKIQLKGHLLFVQLRLKRLWVWTKILTIFGLLLPPPIFLWVCRRQIASNPLLLLQVHGSSLMKGSRDLWDPEGPIHLFHCTKSPHALGVLIWRRRRVHFISCTAIYWGEGLYCMAPECSVVG